MTAKPRKKSVLVSFPTSPAHPYLHKHVVRASWGILLDGRYSIRMMIPTHKPFENNLHHIVNDFMNGDHDFWLTIDADNPPQKNPLDLVGDGDDVVGGDGDTGGVGVGVWIGVGEGGGVGEGMGVG